MPDHPGGGTVVWTDPWGLHKYTEDIEAREDGGTPGFLQTIKAALAIRLKEEMTCEKIEQREEELVNYVFERLENIDSVNILAGSVKKRVGAISFYSDTVHYNLIVRLLNDKHGIQVRGGCSCAGTYGHYLFQLDQQKSTDIREQIESENFINKPGWVRLSIHPTMRDADVIEICDAIEDIILNFERYRDDYEYSSRTNEFTHKSFKGTEDQIINNWFGK